MLGLPSNVDYTRDSFFATIINALLIPRYCGLSAGIEKESESILELNQGTSPMSNKVSEVTKNKFMI